MSASVLDHFGDVEDPRVQGMVLCPLDEILLTVHRWRPRTGRDGGRGTRGRRSAIDGRTTCRPGYAVSQQIRKDVRAAG